ncbi:3'-tyrosyl-DNA phosphodiesterase [Ranunculus cassubicifolius]
MHRLKQRRQHLIHTTNFLQSRITTFRSSCPFPSTPISPNTNLWLQSLYCPSINPGKFLKHTAIDHQVVP